MNLLGYILITTMPSNNKRQIKKYEIDLFDAIAGQGDFDLETAKLHGFVYRFLKDNGIILKGKILEAGCGSGHNGKYFLKKFPKSKIYGVDISPQMIARANDGTKSYRAIVGDLEKSNLFEKESFDSIICFLVLHHFPSLSKIIKNFDLWLKKGGYIIIVEPNGVNLVARISYLLRKSIEIVLGRSFIIKNKMATPNESIHTMADYNRYLDKNHFKVVQQEFLYDEPDLPFTFSVGGIRLILSRSLHRIFNKSVIFQTDLIILGKKYNAK